MDLHSYMREAKLTDAQMAERTGYSESSIGKWRRGERFPRPKQIQRIAEVTEGAVAAPDWFAPAAAAE